MQNLSSTSSFKLQGILFNRGLMGALGLILLVEGSLACAGPWLTVRSESALVWAKKSMSRVSPADADSLIFGDSAAGLGLHAKTFSALTGKRTYNLATVAPYGMAGNYFLLQNYLRRHQAPKEIMLMAAYDLWPRDFIMQEAWPAGSPKTFYRDSLFSDFIVEMMRELPMLYREGLFRIRDGIEGLGYLRPSRRFVWDLDFQGDFSRWFWRQARRVRARVSLFFDLKHWDGDYRDFLIREGSFSGRLQPEILEKDFQEHARYLQAHPFKISKANRYFLKKFLDLCEREGIPVFWIDPPLLQSLADVEPDYFREYSRAIDDFLKSYRGVRRLSRGPQWTEASHLTNAVEHLQAEAAREFTEKISRELESLK